MRIAPLLLLVGCAHTVVTRSHYDRYEAPVVVGEPQALVLDARMSGSRLHVTAQHPRTCTHELHETDEADRHKEGDSAVGDGLHGSDGALVGAVLGFVTAAQVIADKPIITVEDRVVDRTTDSCPLPEARLPITIELPSGAMLEATTDIAGFAEIELPDDVHGTIIVRGGGEVASVEAS